MFETIKTGATVTYRAIQGDQQAGRQFLNVVGNTCINVALGTTTLGLLNAMASELSDEQEGPMDSLVDLSTLAIAMSIGSFGLILKAAELYSRNKSDNRPAQPEADGGVNFSRCPFMNIKPFDMLAPTVALIAIKNAI